MKHLVALLVLPLFAQQVPKERVLGEKLAADIKQESKILEDPTVLSYVRSVGERLIANLDNSPFPSSFDVIVHNQIVEPMTSPAGGFSYQPRLSSMRQMKGSSPE